LDRLAAAAGKEWPWRAALQLLMGILWAFCCVCLLAKGQLDTLPWPCPHLPPCPGTKPAGSGSPVAAAALAEADGEFLDAVRHCSVLNFLCGWQLIALLVVGMCWQRQMESSWMR